jgi:hypothetical protein
VRGQETHDSDNRRDNPVPDPHRDDHPDVHYKVDKRYRESDYFLEDQLRYAESVQEFRSIRDALVSASAFNLGKLAFRFIRAE